MDCVLAILAIDCLDRRMTMSTMHISLPDSMKSWGEDQARSGRYANSSDYVRDLIRRDRVRSEPIAEIPSAIDNALTSGPAVTLDPKAFKTQTRSRNAKS